MDYFHAQKKKNQNQNRGPAKYKAAESQRRQVFIKRKFCSKGEQTYNIIKKNWEEMNHHTQPCQDSTERPQEEG